MKTIALLFLLAASLPATAQVEDTNAYLQRMDSDGDGRVSPDEYLQWMLYAFDKMDRNGDGVLQPDEQPGGRGKPISREEQRQVILARFARYLRESQSIDQRSGVSARFAIAAAETVGAAAQHRSAILGEQDPVARVVDLQTIIGVLRGKLEFESGEEGREQAVLEHLLRRVVGEDVKLLAQLGPGVLPVEIDDSQLEQVLVKTEVKHVVVTPMGEMLGLLKGTLVNFVCKPLTMSSPVSIASTRIFTQLSRMIPP